MVSGSILLEDDIEHPVQAILHRPVGTGRIVERAPQRLAIDRDYPLTGRPQTVDEKAKVPGKRRRIQQPEDAREGVVARNPVLQPEKLPEQVLPVSRKVGKIRADLRSANRCRQRNRQNLQKIVPLGIARRGSGSAENASSNRDILRGPLETNRAP